MGQLTKFVKKDGKDGKDGFLYILLLLLLLYIYIYLFFSSLKKKHAMYVCMKKIKAEVDTT